MKKLFFAIFLLPFLVHAQGDQKIIDVPSGGGVVKKGILHLPDDYASTSTKYPLLIFTNGAGESGTDPSKIYNSPTAGGPAYFIAHGGWPASFKNPKDGKTYKFIVLSAQDASSGAPTSGLQLDSITGYMLANYRVDPTRVYHTGLSNGGIGELENIGGIASTGTAIAIRHTLAAAVPMSAVMNANLRSGWAANIIAKNIHVWGFGSLTDTHGANTQGLTWIIQQKAPELVRFTSYAGGHCCWGTYHNPNYREVIGGVSMNIYEWMLQYSQEGAVSPPPSADPLHAKIWADSITIHYPTTSILLADSSAEAHNIVSWGATAFPTGYPGRWAGGKDIKNVLFANLAEGVYQVRLVVSNDAGNTDTAYANIRVYGPAPATPRKVVSIEAAMFGVMVPIPVDAAKLTYDDGNP